MVAISPGYGLTRSSKCRGIEPRKGRQTLVTVGDVEIEASALLGVFGALLCGQALLPLLFGAPLGMRGALLGNQALGLQLLEGPEGPSVRPEHDTANRIDAP